MKIAFAINENARIYYEVIGEGPPLLLHYGFTSFLEEWYTEGYVDALKTNFQLIIIDPRGHGQSDKPHEPTCYCLEILASDVVAVLDDLNILKMNMLGYSMGGRIAFAVAKYAPERLLSLIVGGATPSFDHQKAFRGIVGDDGEEFMEAIEMLTGEKLRAPIRDALAMGDLRAYTAMMNAPSEPIIDVLETINIPTLLYVGSEDRLCNQVVACANKIASAQSIEIPGLNHANAFTNSGAVVPHIRRFLRSYINKGQVLK